MLMSPCIFSFTISGTLKEEESVWLLASLSMPPSSFSSIREGSGSPNSVVRDLRQLSLTRMMKAVLTGSFMVVLNINLPFFIISEDIVEYAKRFSMLSMMTSVAFSVSRE